MLLFMFISNIKTRTDIKLKNDIFLEYVNKYRQSNNLNFLEFNDKIELASKIQTYYNFNNRSCVHYNKKFPTLKNRLLEANVEDIICYSENIIVIRNIKSLVNIEKRIFDEYIRSESHRENMILGCVNNMGIYTLYDGKDIYSTVVFCN